MLATTIARPIPAVPVPWTIPEAERKPVAADGRSVAHPRAGAHAEEPGRRPAPLAGDGLPLWDEATFTVLAKADDDGGGGSDSLARMRRASLRPHYELLPSYLRLGGTTVEAALRGYGSTLWKIGQKLERREGSARKSRIDAVSIFGGPKSERGAEYLRRCRLIGRFNKNLARMQGTMLERFAAGHSDIVRREIEKLRMNAMNWLANGQPLEDLSSERIAKIIQCEVERDDLDGYGWPLRWLWSKLTC